MEIFNDCSWRKLSKCNFFMQTMDAGTSKSSLDQPSEQTDLPDLAEKFISPSSRVLEKSKLHPEPNHKTDDQFIQDNCSIC